MSGFRGFVLRNPFKRKAITAPASVIDAIHDGWGPFPLLGSGPRQRIELAYNTAKSANYAWIYTNSPAVRTVVDTIVYNIGQLDLRLYEERGEGERQPVPRDHRVALSLRYPSEDRTQDSLIRALVKDFLIFDDAFAWLRPSSGGQVSFHWIPAHMVEVQGPSLFVVENYRVMRESGDWQDFTPGQMLHWHGENPHDPRVGLSRLSTLRGVIAEDAALQQAMVELANAGLAEPAWVFRPLEAPQWSNEARKGFEEDLHNRIRRRNTKPVVMEEGMEMRSFGVSPSDAQMFEMRRWALERVASLYGVPLGMVGLADDVQAAQSQFYADVLPPLCEQFTRFLDQRLNVQAFGDTSLCWEFDLDEKLMGDERLKSLVSASGRAVLTTNESRAMVNRPPIEGGDELVTPLNVIVGENPKPSVDVMGPQDPNGPSQDGDARVEDDGKALSAAPAVKAEASERIVHLSPRKKNALSRQHKHQSRAETVVKRHYRRLGRALDAEPRKAEQDWDRWDRELSMDLQALLASIVATEGARTARDLAGEFNPDYTHNYVRAMAEDSAKALNSTIRKDIVELGVSVALKIQDRHVSSFGASIGARATEFARLEAAKQSPDAEHRVKTWVANTKRHGVHDGQSVPIGDEWPAGFAPGSSPGCKCTMIIS